MHGNGKGISDSSIPYNRNVPKWFKSSSAEVVRQVCSLARKGLTPSAIGSYLRDNNGVGQIKNITGRKVLRLLKHKGLAPEIPEDLYHLIKKAVNMRKHLEKNRKDLDTKFRLILVESRVHRLSRYYKRTKQLPATWRYESNNASALVA